MNKLIQKAIEAIQAGKNDYAIGLLEGLLEMHPEAAKVTPMMTFREAGSPDIISTYVSTSATASPKLPDLKPDLSDSVAALERGVSGKLNAIKAGIKDV